MPTEIVFSLSVIGIYRDEKLHIQMNAAAVDELATCIGLERLGTALIASLPEDHPFRKKYGPIFEEMQVTNNNLLEPIQGEA